MKNKIYSSTLFLNISNTCPAVIVLFSFILDESYTYNTTPVGYTSTSEYRPHQTTTYEHVSQPYTTSNTYVTTTQPHYTSSNQYVTSGTYGEGNYVSGGYVSGGSNVQRAVAEEIPVESRIEYIPFEKKYIEYDKVEKIQRIPYEREIVEYEEVVHNERIPVERTITDYYAVETQVEYIPKEI